LVSLVQLTPDEKAHALRVIISQSDTNANWTNFSVPDLKAVLKLVNQQGLNKWLLTKGRKKEGLISALNEVWTEQPVPSTDVLAEGEEEGLGNGTDVVDDMDMNVDMKEVGEASSSAGGGSGDAVLDYESLRSQFDETADLDAEFDNNIPEL
jgi:hypothetical protein